MPGAIITDTYTCTRCLVRQLQQVIRRRNIHNDFRAFSQTTILPRPNAQSAERTDSCDEVVEPNEDEKEEGAMSRRLASMTEQSLEEGGRSAQKAVEEAGFSEELKRQLEARIQESKFRSENPAAFAQLSMPSSAGKGTQGIAAAQPWTGTEAIEDAALRMLTDAHKPLRSTRPPKIPTPRGTPVNVDMRMQKALQKSKAERLANARDRTSIYALSQDPAMTEKEREQMRLQLKERFTPGARPMPTSVQGLAALANERIEDAIARGQFKNLPRGKGKNIERDYTASSPFLDTTEYFMNKIIQKQDIVPPWIEKQQELVKAAAVFRGRLRADWKRHAPRVIASKGGSLQEQIQRAEAYALAEKIHNPKAPKVEAVSTINSEGRIGQVTVTETTEIEVEAPTTTTNPESQATQIILPETLTLARAPAEISTITISDSTSPSPQPPSLNTLRPTPPSPSPAPFRDPPYLQTEQAYHALSIQTLNTLTRSYNLLAPALAQKPYFSLPRELNACFADVAPLLPAEIRERARAPSGGGMVDDGGGRGRSGGVLERFGGKEVRVWDSRRPEYGFREFWKDLWGRGGG